MAVFDGKNFNAEVFSKYVDQTPNLKRNELIKSKAVKPRQDLANTFKEQSGGNYAVTLITGRIGGTPLNYNGSTDITSKKVKTYTQGRIVVGRADSWVETDFTYDLTGKDFLEQIAHQLGEYWDGVDQDTIISELKGIFSMTGTENLKFVNGHTYDISENIDETGKFGAATLNTAVQMATGDNKGKVSLVFMHSAVATNVENLRLLAYLKYTDKDNIQRNLALGSINGKIVLVDDRMPVEEVAASGGNAAYTKYTTYVLGEGAFEYTNCGVKMPYEIDRDPKTNGGQNLLYGRQRKIFAPYGISWKNGNIISPTDEQLETGSNWEIANSNESSNKEYFPHKAIPIARIISRG